MGDAAYDYSRGDRVEKSRFKETQTVRILQEAHAEIAAREVCRKYDISLNAYYRWKKEYSGMGVSELKRIKELEAEDLRLKRTYSELIMENDALKGPTS